MKSQLVYQWMMLTLFAVLSTACGKSYRTSSAISATSLGSESLSGDILTPDPGQVISVNPPVGGGSTGTSVLEATPVACGDGAICFGAKKLVFTNDSGNLVGVNVSSIYVNGFSANFSTPTGRRMYLHFTISNGSLVTSLPLGWNPQFCYQHGPVNKCAIAPVANVMEVNCSSALHWSGSYNGDTVAQRVSCQ